MNKQETEKYIFDKYKLTTGKAPYTINIKRNHLAVLFAELGYTIGAEIGTEQGLYAKVLLDANPGLKLYGIDSWTVYDGYRDRMRKSKMEGFYEQTKELLKGYDCELIKDWSMEAVKKFANESLDFVYIDGNHEFRYVAEDIAEWSKKVRPGGIISGHDYVRGRSNCQVKDVVCSWMYAFGIKPWFVTADNSPSWLYIK